MATKKKKMGAAPESAAAAAHAAGEKPQVQDPTDLPGMVGRGVERLIIPQLEQAANEVDKLKDKQSRLKDDLDIAVRKVREIMREYDITEYNFGQKRIEREPKDDAIKIKHTSDYVGMVNDE